MSVQNIPEIYIKDRKARQDLFVYDFKMTEDVVKTKVNLSMNMLSFLQVGRKQVHFAGTAVDVNKSQSLLIKNGNCLWTELLDTEKIYFCKLFFFSENKLVDFLLRHNINQNYKGEEIPFFIIENDHYISTYLESLSIIGKVPPKFLDNLLDVKLEEILLYLITKYGKRFEQFLKPLITKDTSSLKNVVENNVFTNLKLEEIAFLCNMSLSTFKRHFIEEYQTAPGKWLQEKRLVRAKEILEQGSTRPSDIYLKFGYGNLSNFSIAFKKRFGVSPTEV